MRCQQGNNLVISRPCAAVRIVGAKVQAINSRACLLIGACGFTAACDELPYKGLCGKPLLIVCARQSAAVALIPIEQGKPYRLFLVRGKGVPCVGRCLCQSVACFQGDTGLDTERRFPVYIHTVFVISRAARSITVNDSTGIVPHGVPIAVIGVGKGNRTNIACRKRHLRGHYGQCRDRRQRKGSGFLE